MKTEAYNMKDKNFIVTDLNNVSKTKYLLEKSRLLYQIIKFVLFFKESSAVGLIDKLKNFFTQLDY